MAQNRLIAAAAGGVVLLAGAAAELVAAPSLAAGCLDWAVGAAWTVAAVRAHRPGSHGAALGLLTATAWFLATALTARELGPYLAIAYRGPLLHWVTRRSASIRTRTPVRVLVVAGYLAAAIGTIGGSVGSGLVAVGLAILLLRSSRGDGPADLRRVDAEAAALATLLGALWLVASSNLLSGPLLETITTLTLLASAWQLSRPAPGLTTAIGTMVLDLGPTGAQASPVSASLAAALADPGLRIRAYRPDLGWRDELGRPAADPGSDPTVAGVTGMDTPGGGRVLLLHGPGGVPETELARAAAAAAALVVERVAAEAQVQREADEVRRSTARLVTVNDAEQEALAARLEVGPIARLDLVARSLRARDQAGVEPLLGELGQVIEELHRLASGLNPIRVAQGSLDEALRDLARASPVEVTLTLSGSFADLEETHAALAYFVSAECLTNVARHAGARGAQLTVTADEAIVRIEVRDDGCGGASLDAGHGLQGLADRISLAGGSLEIHSPPGGPTVIRTSTPRGPAPR